MNAIRHAVSVGAIGMFAIRFISAVNVAMSIYQDAEIVRESAVEVAVWVY